MVRPSHGVRRPLAARRVAAGRPGALGPVLEFMQRLWALDHALNSSSKRMRAGLGITGPQRLVVRIVGRFPGISAGELAQVLHTDPGTLTGILRRLERRAVVRRRRDRDDSRRALLHLSARGRRIDCIRAGTVEAAVRRALSRAPEREVRAASRLLEGLAAALWRPAGGVPEGDRARGRR